ncbi:MAG: hypothetical protein ACI8P3_002680 [Saprospiraceae bacterium]|jgi:hypothetical protein
MALRTASYELSDRYAYGFVIEAMLLVMLKQSKHKKRSFDHKAASQSQA